MNMTTEDSRRTQLGVAAIISILVPLIAALIEPSDELAVGLCFAIVVAARLVRIDFRLPLIPGVALLPIAAVVGLAGANGAAREIAKVGAAMVIVAVLLALLMQAESRVVLRSWSVALRREAGRRAPVLLVLAAVLALAAAIFAVVAAFVLLNASLLAALIASAVALVAHSVGKSPTAALGVLGLLTLALATVTIPLHSDGMRVNFGTMAFVYLFLAGSFALVHALRSAQDGPQPN